MAFLFVACTNLLSAQNLSADQLVGYWKISGVVIKGVELDFTNKDKLLAGFYAVRKEYNPEVVFTHEDSVEAENNATGLYNGFSGIYFNFNSNGTFDGKFVGKDKKESFKGVFSVKDGLLYLKEKGKKVEDKLEVKQPDSNTIILKQKDDDELILTLKRK